MKSEFLQLWDEMLSENTNNQYGIVVVGATYVLIAICFMQKPAVGYR